MSYDCVAPENIHTPCLSPPTEGIGNSGDGGGGVIGPGISKGGRGVISMNFVFFRVSIFIQLYINFLFMHFASPVANVRKKKNLANLSTK